jgi:hypothetical protein
MVAVQTEKPQSESLHKLHIKTIYNFCYRLSGNIETAGVLTENVLLNYPAGQKDRLVLLKQVWSDFLKYYGSLDLESEDPLQKALLCLSPELRCTVILRDILGCSYEQIAAVLDKSVPETARLIATGRGQFAKIYRKKFAAER